MDNGTQTDVDWYKNDSFIESETLNDLFMVDKSAYPAFIGVKQTASGVYGNHWNGFIYEINIYQESYAGSLGTHYSSSCAASCTTTICPSNGSCLFIGAYNKYNDDAGPCDVATCSNSCRNDQPC